jgi:hypothetical protein
MRMDRQTNRHDEAGSRFLNFANEPKNDYIKVLQFFFWARTGNRADVLKKPFCKNIRRLHSNFSLQYLGISVTDLGGLGAGRGGI